MGEPVHNKRPDEAEESNPDWDRTISPEEAQQTAREADPDDLGSTDIYESGLTAGGEGTAVGEEEDEGGTPLTRGYVTGGSHHPTLDDLPRPDTDAE